MAARRPPSWDTLLIDGFDTSSLFTVQEVWEGVDSAGGTKGSNYTAPGAHGERWRPKEREVGFASLGIAVLGTRPEDGEYGKKRLAQFNENWLRIVQLVTVRRRPLKLERRLSLPNEETSISAVAELDGRLDRTAINAYTTRTVLKFRLLEGCWYDVDATSWKVRAGRPVFVPVRGTTDTSKITLELTGGAGVQTLVNESAEIVLSVDWSGLPSGTTVRVDVDAFTAIAAPGNGTASNALTRVTHSGDLKFMLLDPDLGPNRFSISSGEARITYQGAWL